MDEFAIQVNNISKTFNLDQRKGISKIINRTKNNNTSKKLKVLDNISFQVKEGEILGILGLNGSGKSTLLRIIAGVYHPDTGFVNINGKLSPLLQLGAGFQHELNARDNIIMNGMLMGFSKEEIQQRVEPIIRYSELEKFSNLPIKHYSNGMRARLAFSIALQVDPDILLVDEILAVGDWMFKKKSYEAFLNFKKNKKTILYATHSLDKISELSDRVLLLHKGQIVMIGEPNEVVKKYKEISSKK